MSKYLKFFLLLLTIFHSVISAKILGYFPTPSLSHQQTFNAICRELAIRGHHVTSINTNNANEENITNLKEIDISQVYSVMESKEIVKRLSKNTSNFVKVMAYFDVIGLPSEMVFEDEKVQELLNSDETFDILLLQALHPLTFALAAKYKVPVIGVSSYGTLLSMHDAIGNPTHPIGSPDLIFSYDADMNFWVKVDSFLYNIWYRILYYWYELPRSDKIARKYFGKDMPYLGDIVNNVSLVMLNFNPVLHSTRPNVPSLIELDQIHIKKPNPLPKEIRKFLDSSRYGVVYFSLGTNVQSSKLPQKTIQEILSALAELPYDVLWKWETDNLPGLPKNVIIRKWLPQQDILAHPNVKVFITQGGLQSAEETIIRGVPIVGIPFVSDQPRNVAAMVKKGLGLRVEPNNLTRHSLRNAILEVATNQKYKAAVLKAKKLLEDQPLRGLDKAIWWIEYVIRNGDVSHLRSPTANMSFFEYFMVDVIIFLSVSIFAICFVIVKLVKLTYSLLVKILSKKLKTS